MRKLVTLLLCAALLCPALTAIAEADYAPGSYTQVVKGHNGDVAIAVNVGEAGIESIEIGAHQETAGLGDVALQSVADAIVAAGGIDVDDVAGATVSSAAMKNAVSLALMKASGESAAAVAFVPGTYTAEAPGNNGTIVVEASFTESAIADVRVVSSFESAGVADKALTDLPADIVARQSLAVDTVAGATVASNAVVSAVAACARQAGADPALLYTPIEKPAPTELAWTADVVIIGGGGAGLSAAVAATDLGRSVVIVEKEGYVGGNTMVSGGIYNCPDEEMQEKVEMTAGVAALIERALGEAPVSDAHGALIDAVRTQYEAHLAAGKTTLFDSVDWYALQTWINGDKVADLSLVYNMAENAYDTLAWIKSMGYEHKPDIVQGAGSLYQRTHSSVEHTGIGFINCFTDELVNRNAQIVYNTRAEEILMDNGKAVGVKATDRDGNTCVFTANDGVILATGGFGKNIEMVEQYNTSGKWPNLSNITSTNLPGMTGDGIHMAQAVGAALRDMDQIQLLQTTSPKTGNCVFAYVAPKEAAGYLFFNAEGTRFIGEDGRRDDISLAALSQTDALFYMLESGQIIDDPDNTFDLAGVPLSELLKSGDVIKGDTLKALCDKVGWDYETVKAEVDAYNRCVEDNATTDAYGRALFSLKQEGDPWYAIPRTPSVHHTMGGVVIDASAQVLGEDGQVIPGLFAAGEVTGGIHGGNRLGGNAIVDCLVYGRIAGTNCAAQALEQAA